MKEKDLKLLDELIDLVGYRHGGLFKQKIEQLSQVLGSIIIGVDNIVEFGPGISPKSLFALSSLDFKGSLVLVDLDQKALHAQTYVHSRLRPDFTLTTYCADLFGFDLQSCQLVFGNHLLDDLVAADVAKRRSISYQSEVFSNPENQHLFWEQIGVVDGLNTASKFGLKLAEVDSGCKVVLNHYESNFDRVHQIKSRDQVIRSLFGYLKIYLVDRGFTQLVIPDTILKQDEYWLILEKALL